MNFSLMEFSGGLGDLGTFIPLTFALALVTGMDIGVILIFAGLFNFVTGILFGLPIPVQPMKAIAVVAIAEQLLPAEIAAAGLILGAVLLVLGSTGWVKKIERIIPQAVIRGIQLGVGFKLAMKGIGYISETPVVGIDSIMTAAILGLMIILIGNKKRFPGALLLLAVGLGITYFLVPPATTFLQISWPRFSLIIPDATAWGNGLIRGSIPQLPLTLLNSVFAVCALSGDLFSGKKVGAGKMAASVGIMNLLSCGFGAMPMCHGAGGLAGQHYFGARTGGSVVMLGVGKLLVGAFLGATAMQLLRFFPHSVLGVMLLFAGVELAMPARDQKKRHQFYTMLITAIGILAINTTAGFLMGTVLAITFQKLRTQRDNLFERKDRKGD